jgi:hypothetical protein
LNSVRPLPDPMTPTLPLSGTCTAQHATAGRHQREHTLQQPHGALLSQSSLFVIMHCQQKLLQMFSDQIVSKALCWW